MSLFVDTSVWSLALRRDHLEDLPQIRTLARALETGERIVTTGLILQELLQGFSGAKARNLIINRFAALPVLTPDRQDHIETAQLRNHCRRKGIQVGTIDALLAQLCIRHKMTLLTTDTDFNHVAKHSDLQIWAQ